MVIAATIRLVRIRITKIMRRVLAAARVAS